MVQPISDHRMLFEFECCCSNALRVLYHCRSSLTFALVALLRLRRVMSLQIHASQNDNACFQAILSPLISPIFVHKSFLRKCRLEATE